MNHRSLLLINFVWLGFHNLCKHLSRLLWDIDQVSSMKVCLCQCQCPCLFAYLLVQSESCMLFSVSVMHLKKGWSQPLDLLMWYASLESFQFGLACSLPFLHSSLPLSRAKPLSYASSAWCKWKQTHWPLSVSTDLSFHCKVYLIENDYSTTALWYSFMKKCAAPFLE